MRKRFASCPRLLSSRRLRPPPGASRVMLASRMARAQGPCASPRGHQERGRERGAPAGLCCRPRSGCLGFLAERWWLRPAALGLRLPGASPRAHCSGTEGSLRAATGEDAAVEARRGQWGPDERLQPGTYQGGDGEATAPAGSVGHE